VHHHLHNGRSHNKCGPTEPTCTLWAGQESHVRPERPRCCDSSRKRLRELARHRDSESQDSGLRSDKTPPPRRIGIGPCSGSGGGRRRREARGWRSRARSRARRRRATSRPASPRTCSTLGSTRPFSSQTRRLRLLRRSMYSW